VGCGGAALYPDYAGVKLMYTGDGFDQVDAFFSEIASLRSQ
jgi:hypothetical protein